MILTLRRFADSPMGTFGRLTLPDGWGCFTVERPWAQNKPGVSCIPVGTYQLKLDQYHKGGYPAYEVTGVPNRARILIHRANRAEEVEGCIAPGTSLGSIQGEWAVTNSGTAFDHLMLALVNSPPELVISWTGPADGTR